MCRGSSLVLSLGYQGQGDRSERREDGQDTLHHRASHASGLQDSALCLHLEHSSSRSSWPSPRPFLLHLWSEGPSSMCLPALSVSLKVSLLLSQLSGSASAHGGAVNRLLSDEGVGGPCQGGRQLLCDPLVQLTLHSLFCCSKGEHLAVGLDTSSSVPMVEPWPGDTW